MLAATYPTFCDLIITGLVGLRPRPDNVIEINPLVPPDVLAFFCLDRLRYHHDLTILYDRNGTQFNRGTGLRLYVDGKEVSHRKSLDRLLYRLPD